MPTKKAKKKAARLDPRGYATESIPRAPSKESEAERAFPVTCALAVRPGGTVRVTARARVQLSSPSGSRATGFSPQVISQGMPEHLEPFQHGNSRAVETKARTIGVKSTPSPRPRFVAPAFCPIPELDLSPMAETDVPSAKSTRLKPANESRSVPPGNTGIGTSLLGISDEIFPRLSTEGSAQPEDAAVTGDHESSADFPVPEASQPAITRKWHSDDRSPPLFGALVQSPTGACLLVSSSAPSTPQMRPSAWPALPLSAACAGTPSVAGTDASMAREALVSPALSMTTCEVACDAHHADHVDASASGLSDAEFAAKLAEQLDDEDAAAGEGEAPIEEEGVMCAICHGNIQPLEVALVHGCDHPFCCGCILNWALQKQRCPLCQVQFTHLWMYKQLDGTFNDYLREESVALLHRAMWFRKAVVTEFSPQTHADDDDEYHDYLQYEYGGRRDEVRGHGAIPINHSLWRRRESAPPEFPVTHPAHTSLPARVERATLRTQSFSGGRGDVLHRDARARGPRPFRPARLRQSHVWRRWRRTRRTNEGTSSAGDAKMVWQEGSKWRLSLE